MKAIHSALLAATLLCSPACRRKAQEVTHTALPAAEGQVPGAVTPAPQVAEQKADPNNPLDPRNHVERKIIGEEKLKKHWRGIRIKIMDVPNQREALWDVKPGRRVPAPGLGLSMKLKHVVADFAMAEGVIRANSDEPRNPAAEVQIFEGDKMVWEGWIFKQFPETRQFVGSRYALHLYDILPAK